MGGMSGGMMGGQSGADGQQDANSILAQQQALMAMAAGNGGAGAGFDNGNKDALMNLLAKQGKARNFVSRNVSVARVQLSHEFDLIS